MFKNLSNSKILILSMLYKSVYCLKIDADFDDMNLDDNTNSITAREPLHHEDVL